MALFDVSKYETPDAKNIDMKQTRYNVGVFLSAYFSARCRVGQSREPKVTASFSLIPPSTVNRGFESEQILIEEEQAQEEFNQLHELFIKAFSKVQHPSNMEITKRRKQIFFDRYINGYPIYLTAQRNNISEELVKKESKIIITQFAGALELIVKK
ncbi:ArpU family transcriptional regulator [Enterococcus faecalis]|uniref:hypothetical protein n=1 Tax=Enterococcus faecalis TaxID=1351 RepID=UPI0001B2E780|nr:hypothetical protein [Enterococcus faecalis]EEU79981.1 predicted protein [Enterococcus faecalis Fly1]EGO7617908.1 ArpU family transcriptional regulator [Enterococcus faecalis]EGO7913062.1 ArpU family transcriptional regulator [Enterococcus faecalis]EHZ2968482.1 ArpU family transcriptional regulator [Enterococcus faecalis]EIB6795289.1 ArpU family transcriptional regulator [Enterococcus faecalis]